MGGIVISRDSEVKKMVNSARKRVGHGRERELGDMKRGI